MGDPYCEAGKINHYARAEGLLRSLRDKSVPWDKLSSTQKSILREANWKPDTYNAEYITGNAIEQEDLPAVGTPEDAIKLQETENNVLRKVLAGQCSPLAGSAANVFFADAQAVVAGSPLPKKIKFPVVAGCYLLSRGGALVSAASTGYQYQHGLYGTTEFDVKVTMSTLIITAPPEPSGPVMFFNHVSLYYTFLRTFGIIGSP
jgi:hypothetical protein